MTKLTNSSKEPQVSNTFCIRPWTELHIEEDGRVTPCCVMPANRFPMGNTIEEYLQGDALVELKDSLVKGEKHPNCEYCWQSEYNNIRSHRQIFPTYGNPKVIEKIHIRLNNVCNFKCRMCNPDFSTTWQVENKKHNYFVGMMQSNIDLNIFNSDPSLLPLIKSLIEEKSLKCINISGGEPLITDANVQMLNYLIDNNCTDVQLIYSTNLSNLTYKNHNLIDLWKHFRQVQLLASCDGWGSANEYSRTGFSHKQFVKNLKKVFHYVSCIVCVVNVYSVWSIPELLQIMDKLGKPVTFNPCFKPPWLDPQSLPRDLKQKLKDMYRHDPRLIKVYQDYIAPAGEDRTKYLIDYNVMLDAYRKTDFFVTFPQFKKYEYLKDLPPTLHNNVVYKS